MKHVFVLLLLFFCGSFVFGQQKTYSLKECLEIGVRNNLSLKNDRVDILKSETALTQSRSRLLPVFTADFSNDGLSDEAGQCDNRSVAWQ